MSRLSSPRLVVAKLCLAVVDAWPSRTANGLDETILRSASQAPNVLASASTFICPVGKDLGLRVVSCIIQELGGGHGI